MQYRWIFTGMMCIGLVLACLLGPRLTEETQIRHQIHQSAEGSLDDQEEAWRFLLQRLDNPVVADWIEQQEGSLIIVRGEYDYTSATIRTSYGNVRVKYHFMCGSQLIHYWKAHGNTVTALGILEFSDGAFVLNMSNEGWFNYDLDGVHTGLGTRDLVKGGDNTDFLHPYRYRLEK